MGVAEDAFEFLSLERHIGQSLVLVGLELQQAQARGHLHMKSVKREVSNRQMQAYLNVVHIVLEYPRKGFVVTAAK